MRHIRSHESAGLCVPDPHLLTISPSSRQRGPEAPPQCRRHRIQNPPTWPSGAAPARRTGPFCGRSDAPEAQAAAFRAQRTGCETAQPSLSSAKSLREAVLGTGPLPAGMPRAGSWRVSAASFSIRKICCSLSRPRRMLLPLCQEVSQSKVVGFSGGRKSTSCRNARRFI